jgi:hypothetical protein
MPDARPPRTRRAVQIDLRPPLLAALSTTPTAETVDEAATQRRVVVLRSALDQSGGHRARL